MTIDQAFDDPDQLFWEDVFSSWNLGGFLDFVKSKLRDKPREGDRIAFRAMAAKRGLTNEYDRLIEDLDSKKGHS